MDANAITNGAVRWVVEELKKDIPWRGCGALPQKLDGTFYQGINIPALYSQAVDRGVSEALVFGGYRQLAEANMPVRQGQTAFGTIFAGVTRTEKSETDAEEEARIRRAFKPIPVFLARRSLAPGSVPTFDLTNKASVIKETTQISTFAASALEQWQKSRPNKVLSDEERCFITRLAQDLLIAYRTGRLCFAGEWLGAYPASAVTFVERLIQHEPKMMRPWGIATQLLRQFDPELDLRLLAAQATKDAKRPSGKPPEASVTPSCSSTESVKAPNLNW